MSSLQGTSKQSVSVSWDVEMEIHNRDQFQKEGHFVVGGLPDSQHWPIERKWEGELLYVMTLRHMDRRAEGGDAGIQVLRVMGDSPESAAALMADGIKANLNTFAMLGEVKKEADKTAAQMAKDFEAVKAKLDAEKGAGSSVEAIRAARIMEFVG
jgi:hypothetical protein